MNQLDIQNELNRRGLYNVNVIVNKPIPFGYNVCFAETGNVEIGHWVDVKHFPSRGVWLLVDPFGLSNGDKFRVKYLPDDVTYSSVNGQRLGTKYCGLYCIAYYVLRILRGLEPGDAVKELYPETTKARNNVLALQRVLDEHPDIPSS